MYESKNQPLLPVRLFTRRLLLHIGCAILIMAATVLVGVVANVWLEAVSWHDALLNAALAIAGMGFYLMPESVGGKVFFAAYGLFVGLVFVTTLGIILAPVAHRILHKFHLDDD
ncbi:MAG TPA: hypothetical protein DIS96_19215 [Pusillimonas sp.]|nr:hypothetical protein [Pusillimonas sp.]